MNPTISEFCAQHCACTEGREWALAQGVSTMAELWELEMRPEWRVWIATRPGVLSDRELRLWACWCVRQVWHLLEDDRSKRAVEVGERYANGQATDAELAAAQAAALADALDAARAAARAAADTAQDDALDAALADALDAARAAARYATDTALAAARYAADAAQAAALYAAWDAARAAAWDAAQAAAAAARAAADRAQSDHLVARGNPFKESN
jgi:hypothetical protein